MIVRWRTSSAICFSRQRRDERCRDRRSNGGGRSRAATRCRAAFRRGRRRPLPASSHRNRLRARAGSSVRDLPLRHAAVPFVRSAARRGAGRLRPLRRGARLGCRRRPGTSRAGWMPATRSSPARASTKARSARTTWRSFRWPDRFRPGCRPRRRCTWRATAPTARSARSCTCIPSRRPCSRAPNSERVRALQRLRDAEGAGGIATHETVVDLPVFANDQDTVALAATIEARSSGAARRSRAICSPDTGSTPGARR